MATKHTASKTASKKAKTDDWDNEENEAQSLSFTWGRPTDEDNDYKGDRILGVLLSKRQVPNTLKGPGEMQWAYEVKVRECEFHKLDKKKNPIEPSVTIEAGEVITVYGRSFYDGKMRQVKPGQVFGMKYIGDLESKDPKKNDTKEIKVYLPKDENDEFEMDEEVVNELAVDNF